MKRLPPLNPLRAFEAAGRASSIRRASEELNVTPGAISRQVQCLETFLGVQLFRREPREIVLTSEGEHYLEVVRNSLDLIRHATEMLSGSREAQRLHIRCYMTFSMRWLIPRIGRFQEAYPNIELRLMTSNDNVDFDRESVDAAVRLGDGSWQGLVADRLIDNQIAPVCSPAYLAGHPIGSIDDLDGHTLLHSTVRPDDWARWGGGVGAKGFDPYSGYKYASSTLAYQAAVMGQGIVMAQSALVIDDLREGRLVRPFAQSLDLGDFTYYLIHPKNRMRNPAFRKFREWLIQEVERDISATAVAEPRMDRMECVPSL